MRSLSRRTFLAGLLLPGALLLCAPPATAQMQMGEPLRTIPDDARRGRMTWVQGMDVTVDGRPTTLAPGVLIRDRGNLLVVPSVVPADSPIAYQVDVNRQIHRVWVLTEREAATPPAQR